jgi:hypothetical protein
MEVAGVDSAVDRRGIARPEAQSPGFSSASPSSAAAFCGEVLPRIVAAI